MSDGAPSFSYGLPGSAIGKPELPPGTSKPIKLLRQRSLIIAQMFSFVNTFH